MTTKRSPCLPTGGSCCLFSDGVFHRGEADAVDLLLLGLGNEADGQVEGQAVGGDIEGQNFQGRIFPQYILQQIGEDGLGAVILRMIMFSIVFLLSGRSA